MNSKLKLIKRRLSQFYKMYQTCGLCARKCGVNRFKGEEGYCHSGTEAVLYNYGPHHGEEPVLSGRYGSGAIFFSHCTMKCVYCQNHNFSQAGEGKEISAEKLSEIMLELQDKGCHNINLVSPTQYVPRIVKALEIAYSKRLHIPVVYNTGGYDTLDLIKLLDGIVDIFLPDMRYSCNKMAEKYSCAPGYVENNRDIIKEMFSQAGNIESNMRIARKGLIIRLLVLPENISGTGTTLEYIANNISNKSAISLMSQYYPAYKAPFHKELSRRINFSEYSSVREQMEELGFEKGWIQPFKAGFDPRLAGENLKLNM